MKEKDIQQKDNQSTFDYIQQSARKFLSRETAGGLLLIVATIMALLIGNSQWSESYHHYLKNEFLFEFSEYFSFGLTVEEWINDGLMAIFFLVAGLELKREILVGELSTLRKASMPMLAALGGMLVPALIFVSLNMGTDSIKGWGVPMATDIAYSLGIIGLLGKRVPIQLKIFLVALAIADDLGAILIIAFFYSADISWVFLGSGLSVFVLLLALNQSGVKNLYWYLTGGIVLWYFFLNSGVHPTIAGVLFAITVPVKAKLDSEVLKDRTARHTKELEETDIENRNPLEDRNQRKILEAIKKDVEESRPPLVKLEDALTGFNAYFIIPVFALANAGVELDVGLFKVLSSPLGTGILLGLVVGKVVGISLFSFLGEKLGISRLPESLRWWHIIGMSMIAGIGFTMSLFITNLAFSDASMIKMSKISILAASLIAAVMGIIVLLLVKPKKEETA